MKYLLLFISMFPVVTFAADANDHRWQFDVAPYLWAMNLNGRVTTGPLKTHISESFSELLKQFDAGGMLYADAHKGPFGLFFNGVYSILSDHGNIGPFDASVKTHFGIFAGGISYIAYQKALAANNCSQIQLEPYLGLRYTFNNVRLAIASLSIKNNQNWTDPILGLRVRYDMNASWVGELAGDIGGTNTSSQYSYNLNALLGYKMQMHNFANPTIYLGYRYLYQHYRTGSGLKLFDWNMRLFGPMLGVNFSF